MRWCDYCGMPIDYDEDARTLIVRSPINQHGFALLDTTGKLPILHTECLDNIVTLLRGEVTKL